MMCGFQRFLEACILHEVFAEYQRRLRMFLCKTTFAENWFWRVAEFDVEMMKMVFAIFMAIWNVVYCLRMCMLDNKLQTFFNLILFQQLCGREVLWLSPGRSTRYIAYSMFWHELGHWNSSILREDERPSRCPEKNNAKLKTAEQTY